MTMALLAAVESLFAQAVDNDAGRKAKLHYGFAETSLDTALMNNTLTLSRLEHFFDSLEQSPSASVKSVVITSFASMEGDVISNRRYVANRNATAKMLVQTYGNVPDSLITCIDGGIAWGDLRDSVANSDMQYKEEVLYILDNQPEETWRNGTLVDSRGKHLMDLHGGQPYRYMSERFFPYYRYSRIKIVYTGDLCDGASVDGGSEMLAGGDEGDSGLYLEIIKDTVACGETDVSEVEEVLHRPETDEVVVVEEETVEEQPVAVKKSGIPELAVKTNALLLLSGVANAGVEVGIGDLFSFDFPIVYSPYTIKSYYRLRLLAFQPEFRYWFKGFSDGHFLGLTGNFAWYNVALDMDNRYQDSNNRPLMGVGISYGYAWRILPSLSLEFTVGAGYANTHYDVFYNVENGICYTSGVKNYWGLTKAGINVVYVINAKERGRR